MFPIQFQSFLFLLDPPDDMLQSNGDKASEPGGNVMYHLC
jgi:hypothetical protein